MRHARIVCACAGGALLLIVGSAGTAGALEVGRCVASPGTGKYKDAACTKRAGAKESEKAFEFDKNALQRHFTMAGGVALLGTAKAVKQPLEWLVGCGHSTGVGEYHETGAVPSTKQVAHVTVTWTECELEAQSTSEPFGTKCASSGQAAGTIVSGSLSGALGYIKKEAGHPTVGLELHAEVKKGAFVSFACGSVSATVKEAALGAHSCVIGTLAPPDGMEAAFFLNTSVRFFEETGEQIPVAFAGSKHTCTLESNLPTPFLALLGDTITNEEPLEIKA
jgi:hypothetical protein